ncbi:MAG: nitronate monooxygenase [Rhodocyclaceae bacterium]|nr:nitronate monooxygenase [Rhodocyclaceae bacterium]
MSLPERFRGVMSLPVIAAPMFLVSGPALVTACCRAGVAGTFPALNARTSEELDTWLAALDGVASDPGCAPYGVNLILHPSNPRVAPDLELLVSHRTPFVITSLGNPAQVVETVHGYGGLVFSDVVHAHHARKAAAAGVDGIIAVASGAGGHAGSQSAFSLVREIRSFWDGTLILGGAMSDGAAVRAAEVLGADLAYLGTRFIATRESQAQDAYKQMVVDCAASDIVYTDAISGTNANFLWPSLEKAGYTREQLTLSLGKGKLKSLADEARAWRDIWSAGHGVATIDDAPPVAELVERLAAEYRTACALPVSPGCRP